MPAKSALKKKSPWPYAPMGGGKPTRHPATLFLADTKKPRDPAAPETRNCWICGEKGHLSRDCPNGPKPDVARLLDECSELQSFKPMDEIFYPDNSFNQILQEQGFPTDGMTEEHQSMLCFHHARLMRKGEESDDSYTLSDGDYF